MDLDEGLSSGEKATGAELFVPHLTDPEIRAGKCSRNDQAQPLYFTDEETEAHEVRELVRGRAGFPRDRRFSLIKTEAEDTVPIPKT